MFSNFFGKPDPKEAQRQADRELRKVSRDIDREKSKLENEEKKLVRFLSKYTPANFHNLFEAYNNGWTLQGNVNTLS